MTLIRRTLILLLLLGLLTVPGHSAELDQVLENFDPVSEPATESAETAARKFDLSVRLELSQTYNYAHKRPAQGQVDHRGLSWVDPQLDLGLTIDLPHSWQARIEGFARGYTDYSATRLAPAQYKISAEHAVETGFDEVYIEGSLLPWLDIKSGRQIESWGRSDSISVTDVLNPLDLREPGLTPTKDLKLPLAMTRVQAYLKNISVSAIYLHEKRFTETPQFGSDFFPASQPFPPHNKPSANLENAEYGFSATLLLKDFDISLYHARFFERTPHPELNPLSGLLSLEHSKLRMNGAAAAWVIRDFVIKAEGALIDGLEYYAIPGRKKTRYDYPVGIEYAGIKNTLISLETANRHIDDYFYRLKDTPDYKKKDERTTAINILTNLLHNTLHIGLTAQYYGSGSKVAVLRRLTTAYDILDGLSLKAVLVTYRESANFDRARDNDRVGISLSYTY